MTPKRERVRHKPVCGKGHAIEGDNKVVFADDRAADGERWLCRICHEAPKPTKGPVKKVARIETTRGSWGRQARYISALTPVMLAECQARLAREMEKPVGGRPRSRAS